jgi:branched-chain amino acid transport system substrate-binding protein
MHIKGVHAVVLSAVVAVSAAACSSDSGDSGSSGTFKISALLELTGAGGPTFVSAQNGVRTALAEINDAGGVNGRKLEVDILDDQSTPDGSAAQARAAVSDKPIAIISAQGSSNFAGAVPVLQASHIPVVSASIYDSGLLPTPQPWYFSIVPTNPGQVTALTGAAESLLGGLDGKRIAVITPESAALDEISKLLAEAEEKKGFDLVALEKTQLVFTSVAPQAAKIKQARPDAVLVLGFSPTTGPIVVRDLRDAGVDVPLITQYALSSDAVLRQLDDPKFYGMRIVSLPGSADPLVASAKKYGFDQGVDSTFWTLGYQLVQVVKAGLEACAKDCDSKGLTDALNDLKVKPAGAYDEYAFSASDHAGLQQVQFFHLDDSKAVKAATDLISLGG